MIGDETGELSAEVKAIETNNYLLGFMEERDAMSHLEASLDEEDSNDPMELEQERLERLTRAQRNITGSPTVSASDVNLEDLPNTDEVTEHLEKFRSSRHYQNVVDMRGGAENFEFKLVPLESIVAFQKGVTKDTYNEIPTSDDGLIEVIEYCLPVGGDNLVMPQRINPPGQGFSGFQFTSRNPNITITQPNVEQHETEDIATAISVNFNVVSSPNFVQVVEYADRYLLKNGYHRSYQLYQAGETHVPAVVSEAETYEETGGHSPNHFSEDVVTADRPPLISDFNTDASADLQFRGKNKVIRIIAEQFQTER